MSNQDQSDEDRTAVHASVNAFSRVIAVMVLMVLLGLVGYFLDRWLGTNFMIIVGFVAGMILAVFGLLFIARQANQELQTVTRKARKIRKAPDA